MATKAQRGVYAAAITPLGPDLAPDGSKLARYCRALLDKGLDGVAPLGTTGEGPSLPLSFRLSAPGVFAEHGLPGDRVIIGTGAPALGDAVAATRAAVEAGYPNVLVLPPYYFKGPTEEGLYAFYSTLIEQVADPGLRIYLYHFPQMSATPIPITLIPRLQTAFGPIIAGLKDSSGDLDGAIAFAGAAEDFDVYPSNEGVLLKAMAAGCAGVISATTNAAPALARRVADAAGSEASGSEADALQALLAEIRETVARHPLSAALKQLHAWRSGDAAWLPVLPPQTRLPAEAAAALRAALDAVDPEAALFDDAW